MEVEMDAETFGLPLEPKAETKCFESCRSGQNRFRFGFASVDFVSVEFFFFVLFFVSGFRSVPTPCLQVPFTNPIGQVWPPAPTSAVWFAKRDSGG